MNDRTQRKMVDLINNPNNYTTTKANEIIKDYYMQVEQLLDKISNKGAKNESKEQ